MQAMASLKRSSAVERSATSVPSLERPAWSKQNPAATGQTAAQVTVLTVLFTLRCDHTNDQASLIDAELAAEVSHERLNKARASLAGSKRETWASLNESLDGGSA